MERRITEEQATKSILGWLEASNWKIVCFDFPQSGTGLSLHPNEELRSTKNKRAFIPDIVAVKNGNVVFFENKNRFVVSDFTKVEDLRTKNDYLSSIKRLLAKFSYNKIFYGVALVHSESAEQKTVLHLAKVDFVIFLRDGGTISVFSSPEGLFT
jgi:hypothetical protein